MIFVDIKLFETGEVIDLMLDESVCANDVFTHVLKHISKVCPALNNTDTNSSYLMSERNKRFLSRTLSLGAQGIKGGDRLVFIRTDDT